MIPCIWNSNLAKLINSRKKLEWSLPLGSAGGDQLERSVRGDAGGRITVTVHIVIEAWATRKYLSMPKIARPHSRMSQPNLQPNTLLYKLPLLRYFNIATGNRTNKPFLYHTQFLPDLSLLPWESKTTKAGANVVQCMLTKHEASPAPQMNQHTNVRKVWRETTESTRPL